MGISSSQRDCFLFVLFEKWTQNDIKSYEKLRKIFILKSFKVR